MKKIITTFLLTCLIGFSAISQTLFEEGFEAGIPNSFTLKNVDGNTPAPNLISLFGSQAWRGGVVFTGQPEVFAASTSSYNPPGTADDWMITPAINLPPNVFLFWSARSGSTTNRDGYEVRISTTGTSTADFSTVLFSTTGENPTWTERQLDLSAYKGQTVYLAFRNNSTDKYLLAVDYILLTQVVRGDAKLDEITVADKVAANSLVNVTGTVSHQGLDTLHSLDINWRVDGGAVHKMAVSGLNIKHLQKYSFTHNIPYSPNKAGSTENLEVWISNINGMGSTNTSNDTIRRTIYVSSGTGVQRNVLFEEFTTARCQFCPDGHVVMAEILSQNQHVIPVSIHSCFYTDAMTTPDASTFCSVLGDGSAPAGMVDRIQHSGDSKPAHSRTHWKSRVNSRSAVPSEAGLIATGSYNSQSRAVSLDVDLSFVDFVEAGDIRVSLMVIEDSLSGSGSGWNQSNAYNNQNGHPMQGRGNPIIGYQHRHVLREVLPSTWGDASVVPNQPSIDAIYSKNFSFTLNNSYNADRVSLVAIVSYKGTSSDGYEVINAKEVKLANSMGDAGLDAALMSINIPRAVKDGDSVEITATVRSVEFDTLNSFDLNWSIDNGTTYTSSFSNLNMGFGDEMDFAHNDWANFTGLNTSKSLKVWITNINGGNDNFAQNNTRVKSIKILPAIDAALTGLIIDDFIGDGKHLEIKGEVKNEAADTIKSINVSWAVNGGAVFTDTLNNLDLGYGESMVFTSRHVWTAAGVGTSNNFEVWISNTNGVAESNTANDTLSAVVKVEVPVDLELTHLNVSDTLVKGEVVEIKGAVKNIGAEVINSFVLSWTVNGGTVMKDTISNLAIPYNVPYNFTHTHSYIPSSSMTAGTLDVYIESVNGSTSQVTGNDSLSVSFVAIVGLDESITLLDKVNIYPNPTSSITNLDLILATNINIEVSIFDISGKALYHKNYGKMNNGSHKLPINVSALQNGLYIMRITAGDEVITRKISVIK